MHKKNIRTSIFNSFEDLKLKSCFGSRKRFEPLLQSGFLLPLTVFSIMLLSGNQVISKDCGPIPPGAMFDKNCNIKPVPPPNLKGDAEVIAEVTKVSCGLKSKDSQEYTAKLTIDKTLRGKVEKNIQLRFYRYFDEKVRLGDSGISFLEGDRSQLILTKYKDYWAVQFPHHKKILRASAGTLPICK